MTIDPFVILLITFWLLAALLCFGWWLTCCCCGLCCPRRLQRVLGILAALLTAVTFISTIAASSHLTLLWHQAEDAAIKSIHDAAVASLHDSHLLEKLVL